MGFRPFVYRIANRCGLKGWVSNSADGVEIQVEGPEDALRDFLKALETENPSVSIIQDISSEYSEPEGFSGFRIRQSRGGKKETLVLPDLATCGKCMEEVLDPGNRRFRYPFTNCTECGPRYSIIRSIPYDRPATTMASFKMCSKCRHEYEDPFDRRFHAQPNACPQCGPHLELWDGAGQVLASRDDALRRTASEILEGRILSVKGLGGFHLMALAENDKAVMALRKRKGRMKKPFALMFPSVDSIREVCSVSSAEEDILSSYRSPIVLLSKLKDGAAEELLSGHVAPGNPELGVMLPYTPLHHLLMMEIGRPVIATSGNVTDEPICIDEHEALRRLEGLADLFLVHDRPIARHVDDSVVRVFRGEEMIIRRARGYAPLPVGRVPSSKTVLATGPHLKNTVALSVRGNVFVSQHIGDLETPLALGAFDEVRKSLVNMYGSRPDLVACDVHPDYASTTRAHEYGLETFQVQHHKAHVYSCMLERGISPPILGIAWDGTGYGSDGTVWGGEFFVFSGQDVFRAVSFRQFRLPGGDAASVEPRRCALGVLQQCFDDPKSYLPPGVFSEDEYRILIRMIERGFNSPLTSSVGRLFDAVASLLGIRQINEFEAQAAMALEHSIGEADVSETYPFGIEGSSFPITVDWEPLIRGILRDRDRGLNTGVISAKFHNTLSKTAVAAAETTGQKRVVLTGGCFQNLYLLERTCRVLEDRGFQPIVHSRLPANDGGIAPGQVLAAAEKLKRR